MQHEGEGGITGASKWHVKKTGMACQLRQKGPHGSLVDLDGLVGKHIYISKEKCRYDRTV